MLSCSRSSWSSRRALVGAGELRRDAAARASRNQAPWRRATRRVSPRAASCSAAYSRIVSSTWKRGSPAVSTLRIRLWSASDDQAVDDVHAELAGGPAHGLGGREVDAALEHRQPIEQAPVAARRAGRSSRRSRRAASAAAPAGRARRPTGARAGPRAGSRSASGENSLIRAAASSIARGMPCSRAAIAATAGAFSFVTRKSGRTAVARAMNSRTASYVDSVAASIVRAPRPAGSPARARSAARGPAASAGPGPGTPARPRRGAAARDVTSADRPGRVAQQVGDDRAGVERPARSCRGRAGRCLPAEPLARGRRRPAGAPALGEPDRRRRSADATSAGLADRLERDEEDAVRDSRSAALAATWSDSRVLPVPPGPVSVTSRFAASSAPASASSRSRPTNDVSCVGRLFGRASSERSGGNSIRSPSATTWHSGCGSRRSFSRWSPRPRSEMPGRRGPPVTSERTASDTTTWPPWAAAAIRAARLMSRPDEAGGRRRTPRRRGGPSGR